MTPLESVLKGYLLAKIVRSLRDHAYHFLQFKLQIFINKEKKITAQVHADLNKFFHANGRQERQNQAVFHFYDGLTFVDI